MGKETKAVNYGGKTIIVDRIEELRPLQSSKLNAIKSAINTAIQNNNSQASSYASNFSLNISGDYELSTEFEDDGVTVRGYTDITAEVLYYRSGHNMLVADIPQSAYTWYMLGDSNPIKESSSSIRITKTGQYQCIVAYDYQIAGVETGIERIIPIKLSAIFTIKNGTITLYTRSNAETTAELLQSLDNLRWFPDPDAIDRTEKYLWRKESSDGGVTWTYFRIEGLDGADGKPAPNTLVQYQYSDSDRTPPNRFYPFIFGGGLVFFKKGVLGDDNSKDWIKDPPKTGKYKWMRISTDNGLTWDYSVISGPEPSFFELLSSKDNFRQNERGAVDEEDSITFWIVRHSISTSEKVSWKVVPDSLFPNAKDIDTDSIEITVPVGFELGSFEVYATVGTMSETLSKQVFGQKNGTLVPKKLNTIDRTTEPPEPFPTTLSDGVSPVRDGDYLLVRLSDNGKPYLVPYRYSERINPSTGEIEGWVPSSSDYPNHSEIMGSVLQEVLASSQTTPSVSAMYGFIKSLIASDASIEAISALNILLRGSIYSGAYDKYGNKTGDGKGFFAGANGLLMAVSAIFENATIYGKFVADAFETFVDIPEIKYSSLQSAYQDFWINNNTLRKTPTTAIFKAYSATSQMVSANDDFALVMQENGSVTSYSLHDDGFIPVTSTLSPSGYTTPIASYKKIVIGDDGLGIVYMQDSLGRELSMGISISSIGRVFSSSIAYIHSYPSSAIYIGYSLFAEITSIGLYLTSSTQGTNKYYNGITGTLINLRDRLFIINGNTARVVTVSSDLSFSSDSTYTLNTQNNITALTYANGKYAIFAETQMFMVQNLSEMSSASVFKTMPFNVTSAIFDGGILVVGNNDGNWKAYKPTNSYSSISEIATGSDKAMDIRLIDGKYMVIGNARIMSIDPFTLSDFCGFFSSIRAKLQDQSSLPEREPLLNVCTATGTFIDKYGIHRNIRDIQVRSSEIDLSDTDGNSYSYSISGGIDFNLEIKNLVILRSENCIEASSIYPRNNSTTLSIGSNGNSFKTGYIDNIYASYVEGAVFN